MKCLFNWIALLALATTGVCAESARILEKANVLPLALDDKFQFRKTKTFLNDPLLFKESTDQSITFERLRVNFGAITRVDRDERLGHYFTFYWRAKQPSTVRVRLEYRQRNLGSHVQAQELSYEGAKGSLKSEFKVTGDDYRLDGPITAWRALIIENGKIVALNQSFLWN